MATPTEEATNKGMGGMGADYALYAAHQDPLTTGAARAFSEKTGLDETLSKDLMLFLQKLAGMQNGGVMMAANMQANINRVGAPAMMPGSPYQGTINGNNILAMQASTVMMREMTGRFFDSRGLPTAGAHGLSMAEMGQVTGHLMASGGAHRFGPLMQTERMTTERLDQLKKEGQEQYRTTGSRKVLDSIAGLKDGDLRFTMTDNADKFAAYLEDGAKVVSSLKEIFGSRAIKDLDAAFQTLLGGGMQEFGARAARIKMAGIKASGNVFFGGNMQEASAWSSGNAGDIAAQIGAQLGVDPSRAQDLFRMLGAHVGTMTDVEGLIGGRAQQINAATLGATGIDLRPKGTAEIQREINADIGAYATQEKEMLALSRFTQAQGNTLSKAQRQEIDAAIGAIGGAGNEAELTAARSRAGKLFQDLSGQEVGSYVGDAQNQAKLLGELSGEGAAMFGRGLGQIHRTRTDSTLARAYHDDEELRRLGLDADEAQNYGLAAAHLSGDQFADMTKIMKEGRTSSDMDAFLGRSDVKAALEMGGVDTKKLTMGLLGGDINEDQLAVLRGKTNTYDKTGNFVGEGDRMKAARDMLSDFVAKNQSGPGNKTDDLATEFMRGIYGDSPPRGGALVAEASKRGMTAEQGLSGFGVDATTGMIKTDDENLKALVGGSGGEQVWRTLGLQSGDMAGLKDALKNPDNSRKIMEALGGETGAFRIDKGRFEYLSKDAEKGLRDEFTRKGEERLYKGLIGDHRDMARREGETDEKYNRRRSGMLNHAVREAESSGKLDQLVDGAAAGAKGAGDVIKSAYSSKITDQNKQRLMNAVDKAIQSTDEGISSKSVSEEDKNNLRTKLANLSKLKEELTTGQDGRKGDPQNVTMNVQNVTINGAKQKL